MEIDELCARRQRLTKNTDAIILNMEKITNESFRVADVEKNSKLILENLEKEFERKTGLKGNKAQIFYT